MNSKKEFSAGIRIYHWLNAITVILILLTVFTRKNWLEKFKIRDLILDFTQKHTIEITEDTAMELAKLVRNEIWHFHYYLGIFLSALLVARIVMLFFPSGRRFFIEGLTIFKQKRAKRASVKFIYIIVYIALVVTAITGLSMYFHNEFGISESGYEALEALHVGIVTLIIYFVPLHLIGVILGELGNDKDIVSGMINGGKENK